MYCNLLKHNVQTKALLPLLIEHSYTQEERTIFREGIDFKLSQQATQSLNMVNQAYKYMISIILKIQTGKLTAPLPPDEEKGDFYNKLQVLVDAVPWQNTLSS